MTPAIPAVGKTREDSSGGRVNRVPQFPVEIRVPDGVAGRPGRLFGLSETSGPNRGDYSPPDSG